MENTTATTPELKLYAYDAEYARSKKTCTHYWTLDLIKALSLLAVIGAAFLLRNVIAPGSSMYVPFIIGLLAAAFIIYLIFKSRLHHRTDAWFCSFAQRDGKLYHLEFTPRQSSGIAGFFGNLFDAARSELSIKAAADPDMANIVISCKESGMDMPQKDAYKKIEVTELPDAKLTLSGKKITITYTNEKGRPDKLVTADCFKGLVEDVQ